MAAEKVSGLVAPSVKHRYTGVQQISLVQWSLTYKDVFSMNYLVALVHEWLVDNGYAKREGDADFGEKMYVERLSPAGREIWIRWRLNKVPKIAHLFRWDIDIDFHAMGLKEVEVMHKGQKYKADKGEVEVSCAANLIIDPERTWENHWFFKHFKNPFLNRTVKGQFGAAKGGLFDEAYRLQEAVKTYLKLETFLPEREGAEFWAKKTPE